MYKISLEKIIDLFKKIILTSDNAFYEHHQEVAYLTFLIAKKLHLKKQEIINLVITALIHDFGALQNINLLKLNYEKNLYHTKIINKWFKKIFFLKDIIPFIIQHHNFSPKIINQILPLAEFTCQYFRNKKKGGSPELKDKILNNKELNKYNPRLITILTTILNEQDFSENLINSSDLIEAFIKKNNILLDFNLNDLEYLAILLIKIVFYWDAFTAKHSFKVAEYTEKIARDLKLNKNTIKLYKIAALLHDLGKIGIPQKILNKPGTLTDEEYQIMKKHSIYTLEILKYLEIPEIIESAGYHHEKLNGKGYPLGLKGEKIPLGAQILAVADIYSALREDRPYRKKISKQKTLEILNNLAKEELNPEIVKLAEKLN